MNTDNSAPETGFIPTIVKMLTRAALVAGLFYYLIGGKKIADPIVWNIFLGILILGFSVWIAIELRKLVMNKIYRTYKVKVEELERALHTEQHNKSEVDKGSKVRIVVLLPLHDSNIIIEQDVALILEGFGNAFPKVRNKMDLFELNFLDHKNNGKVAEEIVLKELRHGCQYFVCTMSEVCEHLSSRFPELLNSSSRLGILLCTVAATPKINIIPNKVYRFYVNALDEASCLVQQLKDMGKTASMIHFDTPYSRITTSEFKALWNRVSPDHTCDDGIELQQKDYTSIVSDLHLSKNRNKLLNKNIIFIVSYCSAYQQIFSSLKDMGIRAVIATTSTFSFKKFTDAKQLLLDNFQWVTCCPRKKDKDFYGDAANYFAFASLYRLIETIFHEDYTLENFDDIWCSLTLPTNLEFHPSGDSKILLDIHIVSKQAE